MIKCNLRNYFNITGTRYCQKCGNFIKRKSFVNFFKGMNFGGIAGLGSRGVSIAPATQLTMEISGKFEKYSKSKKKTVMVVPLEDGTWYCPDCGQYNKSHSYICLGCGSYTALKIYSFFTKQFC